MYRSRDNLISWRSTDFMSNVGQITPTRSRSDTEALLNSSKPLATCRAFGTKPVGVSFRVQTHLVET